MSGTSTSVSGGGIGVGMGYGYGYRPPFTAVQWQELEHQAMIYKYLVAGVPVPSDLVVPIRRSFEALSSRLFHHPSLGYCSYYGKKFDPEPGRCRRTDGKKWRCSKDAYPDSKYCERHMHRGRNRSRKPVESQSTASQPLSTATSHITSGSSNSTSGSFQSTDRSFHNISPYPIANSEGLCYGSPATKLQMDCAAYGRESKEFWYNTGMNPNANEHNLSRETSAGSLGMGSGVDNNAWHSVPFQVSSSSPMLKLKNDSLLLGSSSPQMHLSGAYEPLIDSPRGTLKQEQQSVRPFFSEWPATKESWSNLDSDGSNTTQLSMSIPMTTRDFSSRNASS